MGNFQLFDVDQDAALSGALTRFLDAGPPPLVVTPGTANAHAAALFALAAQAVHEHCRHVAARFDGATGPEPLCRAIEALLDVAPG